MSKNANAAANQSSQDQKTDLLQALNAAAGSLQRSARSREAVFRAFEEQTAVLGWDGSIMLLDETGQHLTVTALAYPPLQLSIMNHLGRLFNKEIIGFTFALHPSSLYYQIVRNKRPYFVTSNTEVILQVLPEYGRSITDRLVALVGNRPAIFAPIISGNAVKGVVNIAGAHVTGEEIPAVEAFAHHIAIALENADLISALQRQRQEAEMLMNVTTALTSTLNLDQVLNNILVHLQQVVPFVSACIFLIRDNMVQAVAGYHLPDNNAFVGNFFPVGNDVFIAQMRKTRQPVILEDAQKEANFNTWGNTGYVRGWMGVPLLVREEVIGYVTLDNDKVGAYQEKETRLAQAFVNQAAIAIENAQLFAETQRLLGQTREQTQQLQQIMNIVPDGILLLDNQQRIVSVNQAGENYLNTLGEIMEDGRLVRIGQYTLEELYQSIPTPPPWKELRDRDGKFLFEAAAWPLDRAREKEHWVLVIQDVTEERAKQSYRLAQERLAIVGQMAAGIAHDFNNIMAVIVLYTQMLLRMPNLPPKEEKRLLTIFQQSRRASELIHQILDFSRQSLLERRPLRLRPFLKELTHLLQRTLPENIDIIFEYQEGEFLINGDPTRIQQIVMNLALNAKDAMPDGGVLKLSLKEFTLTEEQESPLPDMAPGNWLEIQVCDNGKGITADNLSHIFEPFFTTKVVGQGTGLGLAQVYGIVKQHEGFIDVQSTLNQSTTFTIYLPAFEPDIESLPESKPELPRSGKHETILVVEDDENARMAVVEILEMLNYNTLAASNGAEALVLFKNHYPQIDLVLSDMVMPIMDGAALHLALRKIQPDVKMVIMTGYPIEQSGKTFLKQNVVAWMQKPLHTEQIARTIYQALNETHD